LLQESSEDADGRERAAHIGDHDLIDMLAGQRLLVVVRHGAGEAGRMDQHVGTAQGVLEQVGDPA